MTEVEAFLARNQMVRCQKMHANITRAKCEELKKAGEHGVFCSTCEGSEEMGITCGKCNESGKKNQGRGLCPKCYYQEFRAGTLRYWNNGAYGGQARVDLQQADLTVSLVGDGKGGDDEVEAMLTRLENEIMFDESLPGTPAMDALAKEVDGLAALLPVVAAPAVGRSVLLPESLVAKLDYHGITDEFVVDLLDALVHGELERHPYRRVA